MFYKKTEKEFWTWLGFYCGLSDAFEIIDDYIDSNNNIGSNIFFGKTKKEFWKWLDSYCGLIDPKKYNVKESIFYQRGGDYCG